MKAINLRLVFGLLVVVLLGGAGFVLLGHRQNNLKQDDGKLVVTASFYPLAEFARQIGGGLVSVHELTPAGTEPHDYEPTPADRVTIQRSRVLIYNGAGLEAWVSRVLPDLGGIQVVNATDGLLALAQTQGVRDPHLWLDPVIAGEMVNKIKDGLIAVDSSHQATYQQNAERYLGELQVLDREYHDGLAQCQRREIVTSHAAFAYLARQYGLIQEPIAGLAEEEPSPAKLAEIARYVRDHHVTTIFFESLASPRLSETIANETGAKTAVLNPIEGLTADDKAQGKNYLSIMRDNLAQLKVALQCQ